MHAFRAITGSWIGTGHHKPKRTEGGFTDQILDIFEDHYQINELTIEGKTEIGRVTVIGLHLNRKQLLRLRDIRQRYHATDRYVAQGINGLRNVPIDRLPSDIKGRVFVLLQQATATNDEMRQKLNEILRERAASPLLESASDDKTNQGGELLRAAGCLFARDQP